MQTDDVTIRARVLGDHWEVFGADRAIQVVPESVNLSSNEWGSDTATFQLKRDPSVLWPDLQAFSPIEVEIGGVVVWTGRILETPSSDSGDPTINVQCQGWQYHLDDDSYADNYVHTKLSDWRDYRTFPTANLGRAGTGMGVVSNDNGMLTFGFPKGVTLNGGSATYAGVLLDLGPYARGRSVVFTYDFPSRTAGSGFFNFAIGAGDDDNIGQTPADTLLNADVNTMAASGTASALGPITVAGPYTASVPRRFLSMIIWFTNAGNVLLAEDNFIRIRACQVFRDTAFEGNNGLGLPDSVLTASQVIPDALSQGAPLLSTDRTQVASTSFAIPDLHFPDSPQTPREVITGVNAFHNYITQVDTDARMVFQPRPTAPLFEVGPWGGSSFDDSSMNAGDEIYSRVLVTGTGPDGTPLIVERSASQQPGVSLSAQSLVAMTNGDFEAGTLTGWTLSGSPTPVRDTTVFDSGAASLKLPGGTSPGATATGATTGTFRKGITYLISFRVRQATSVKNVQVSFGGQTNGNFANVSAGVSALNAFQTFTMSWTPSADVANATFRARNTPNDVWIDNIRILSAQPTIVDRWGFRRTKILPVDAPLTTLVASKIGDTYVQAHMTQPLKGNISAATSGIRRITSGETVHPAHLLRNTQQLIRLAHRIDPDTGGQGRDGTIASVSYSHDDRTSAITLDDSRTNFESLLARYSIIAGTRLQS